MPLLNFLFQHANFLSLFPNEEYQRRFTKARDKFMKRYPDQVCYLYLEMKFICPFTFLFLFVFQTLQCRKAEEQAAAKAESSAATANAETDAPAAAAEASDPLVRRGG